MTYPRGLSSNASAPVSCRPIAWPAKRLFHVEDLE